VLAILGEGLGLDPTDLNILVYLIECDTHEPLRVVLRPYEQGHRTR
jgi:hypothetical protein